MNTKRVKDNIFLYAVVIFIINILQAYFTNLHPDEAYYYVYSQKLSWGYFDHPPMIALFIKIGYYIFHNELGVRLLTVFSGSLTFVLLWKYLTEIFDFDRHSEKLFFLIYFSLPVFNLFGFMATPDAPLLLFSTIYLIVFENFRKKTDIKNTLLLGLTAALLIYSKYHGALLILFTIIPNIKLLKKYNIWLSGIIALVLLIPHILWQINNNFPTLEYHLIDRNLGLKINNFTDYLSGAILILNPFFFVISFRYYRRRSKKLNFYYFIFFAVLIFFLLSNFKSRVEAHWVAIASFPVLAIIYYFALNDIKLQKYIKYFSGFTIFMLLIVRILLVSHIPLSKISDRNKFIEFGKITDTMPVVFLNSYQGASLYEFYTNKKCYSLNTLLRRQNQYTLLNKEEKFFNKDVILVYDYPVPSADKFEYKDDKPIFYTIIKKYVPLDKLSVKLMQDTLNLLANKSNIIPLKITNNYHFDIVPEKPQNIFVWILLQNSKQRVLTRTKLNVDTIKADTSFEYSLNFYVPDTLRKDKFKFKLGFSYQLPYPANNSKVYTIQIQ